MINEAGLLTHGQFRENASRVSNDPIAQLLLDELGGLSSGLVRSHGGRGVGKRLSDSLILRGPG